MKTQILIIIIFIIAILSCKNVDKAELSKVLPDNSMLMLNIRFINTNNKISFEIKEQKIIDGKVKNNSNMAKRNGNIGIQILDNEKNIIAESIEKNPLVIFNEYQDENGSLRTMKTDINENEILVRYNINKYPKYVKISRYDQEGNLELINIVQIDK